jgi:3-methyladenine DNA glycosylase/8-oxoguanine DNA glycosylase
MSARTHLSKADPAVGQLIKRIGPLKLGRPDYAEPYQALLSAVAHQQLHGRAALAILGRLKDHAGGELPAPAALLAMPDTTLRACGFSANKTLALRDIAARGAGRHHSQPRSRPTPQRCRLDRTPHQLARGRPMDRGNAADVHAPAAGCVPGR